MRAFILLFVSLLSLNSNAVERPEYSIDTPEYTEFWEDWHSLAKEVRSCDESSAVVKFLIQSLDHLACAECTEANAGVIEDIVLRLPGCFCNAYRYLSHDQKQMIGRYFIRSPLYHEPAEMENALKSAGNHAECSVF